MPRSSAAQMPGSAGAGGTEGGSHVRCLAGAEGSAWPDEDDLQREFDAAHSIALVGLLRENLFYEGLLGLDKAPSSISHPSLSELEAYPVSEHPRLIRDAVLRLSEGWGLGF